MPNDNQLNLTGIAAQKKIQALTEGEVCHFVTYNNMQELITKPMFALQVDEGGNLWFTSNKHSHKIYRYK